MKNLNGEPKFNPDDKDKGLTGIGEEEIKKKVEELEKRARVNAEKMLKDVIDEEEIELEVGDIEYVDKDEEEIELDVEDIEYVDKEGKVESKIVESPISPFVGEKVESYENDTFTVESHLGTMYDEEDRRKFENIEDIVVINPKEDLVALGDGMGGVGKEGAGARAAEDFKNMFENVRFGDLEGLSDEEIKADFFTKLKGMSENISEGMITCTMIKFFKDKEGNKKAVAVNIGDGCLYYKNNEGKVSEVIEALSPWEEITKTIGNILDEPDYWAMFLNGMRRSKEISGYLKKISKDSEMQTLRDKFDFHKVMQYVENDRDLDEVGKKNIFKLFKNINRHIPASFNMTEVARDKIEPWGKGSLKIVDVQEGDQFFMGSDGITDNLDSEQIAELINENFSSKQGRQAVREKINASIKNKGYFKSDDHSYVSIGMKG